ncbi:MAG TPA: permease prefix domain 1-containing protein [Pyrinomonadaceae bacterium]|nr:permease prefix domain 1-containing protein [Pyrinomonadaceae bacterium]
MSWIQATIRFLHAWRHPDEIAREVEAELRFHIEMRTRANMEVGMRPDQARLAARQSFGDFDRVKTKCCEISRSLPVNSTVLKMAIYITIAVLAGGAALWAVNMPHHNFAGVLWQLVAIVVLARTFVVGRRAISTKQFAADRASGVYEDKSFRQDKGFSSDVCETHGVGIKAHDEHGRTPVERMFN